MAHISITREFKATLAGLQRTGAPPPLFYDRPGQIIPDITAAAAARRRHPGSALLGIGDDGLPIMLDLADPSPGPILLLGDAGSGKTSLLRFVAWALTTDHYADEVQYGALTSHSDEWAGLQQENHCLGILDGSPQEAASVLAGWVGGVRGDPARPALLLLIDDPTMLHPSVLDLLHWLLQTGPAARIWPLVALNAQAAVDMPGWVARFRTRIFGRISRADLADEFTPAPGASLHNLRAGAQYTIRSEGHWLRFRLPRD